MRCEAEKDQADAERSRMTEKVLIRRRQKDKLRCLDLTPLPLSPSHMMLALPKCLA
jgi:hypothetical protein